MTSLELLRCVRALLADKKHWTKGTRDRTQAKTTTVGTETGEIRMLTVQERVQRGAQLLDSRMPGWEYDIDLSQLNIDNPYTCILGQLGGYTQLVYRLFGSPARTVYSQEYRMYPEQLHGFCSAGYVPTTDVDGLTQTWRELIAARRMAELAQTPVCA